MTSPLSSLLSRVMIRICAEGDTHWRLEVEDRGIGIKPDDVPRLFVEFQQLDAGTRRRHEGSGSVSPSRGRSSRPWEAASGCGASWDRAASSSPSCPG